MSYPYPPMGPGQPPPGGQPGGWGGMPPPPDGYGPPPGPGWPGQQMPPPGPGWPGQQMPPPGPPMSPPPMGGPPMGPPPPRNGNGGTVIVAIIAAVAALGGILGGAYLLAGGSDDGGDAKPAAAETPSAIPSRVPATSTAQTKPGYYDKMESWSLWDNLNTAAQDSDPLTLSEVFSDSGAKSEKDGLDGTYFNLQGSGQLDTDCSGAVWGAQLKAAVQSYECTQVVRAPYVSADRKWIGQLAIFNLKDVTSANALLDDLDPDKGKGFLVPVTGPAPIDQFGRGTTGAESGAYGHFVVVGWAGSADGSRKSEADMISPSSTVQEAGKEFLFHRN